MDLNEFLTSIGFGRTKSSSLDDILKESYSLAFPYKIVQEEVGVSVLCPKCKGTIDYYGDALRGGPEGSEMATEWKCPQCGEILVGDDYNEMDEDTPFDKSASIWGSHPPKRQPTSMVTRDTALTPEVLPKHYDKNRKALMQVLSTFGIPSETADEIIRNSESPEAKEKMKRVIFKVLTLKYGLPETEAKEFMDKYGEADVDDMIKGVMGILGREALPGATRGAPRLSHIREAMDRVYRHLSFYNLFEGFGSAKRTYVDTGKLHKNPAEGLRILKMLAEKDPTYPEKGKYVEWMAKTFRSMPSMAKYEAIRDFDKYCELNQIEKKDINQYANIEQVDDAVRVAAAKYQAKKGEAESETEHFRIIRLSKDIKSLDKAIKKETDPAKKKSMLAKKAKLENEIQSTKGFLKDLDPKDIVWKGAKVIVVRPPSVEKSCKYGVGSNWCTAAQGSRNYFNSYYFGRGVNLYYMIPLIDLGDEKYNRIAIATYPNSKEREYYDIHDSRIDNKTLIDIMRKLGFPEDEITGPNGSVKE